MQIINTLYHNILEGEKYIHNLQVNKYETTIINNNLLKTSTYYFPKEIKQYIQLHIHNKVIYNTILNGKNIQINLYTKTKYSNNKNNDIIFKILLIIYILSLYSSPSCSKNLIINIYFTPLKRLLPKNTDDILEPIHVNGGFSLSGCNNKGEITIYREEEWYKVLIHELFHSFNLDFSRMNIDKWSTFWHTKININNLITKKNEILLFETYCEIWARILNVMLTSFFIIRNHTSYRLFLSTFNDLIAIERNYSLLQCNKIYKKLQLNTMYREKTNTICYYVFTGALMHNYKHFLKWCNLQGGLQFTNSIKNVNSFNNLIVNEYDNPKFLESMKIIDNIKSKKYKKYKKSLRMSII